MQTNNRGDCEGMSKWQAIKAILGAANYIVITDVTTKGSISPIYADKFMDKLQQQKDELYLVHHKYTVMLSELAEKL
jgi:hypothetical protein